MEVAVPGKVVPHFKPGKELHGRLNLRDGPPLLLLGRDAIGLADADPARRDAP